MMTIIAPSSLDLENLRDGYPALASWIGRDPDGETLVFRRFRRLSARNILHLQSQLIQLEQEIDDLDEKARKSVDLDSRQALRRWETFTQLAGNPTSPEKRHLDKIAEFSVKITEYEEALLRQSQIAALSGPSDRVLSTYRAYLDGRSWKGSSIPAVPLISGKAKAMLNEEDDLVALRKPPDDDILSKFVQDHWSFRSQKAIDPLDCTAIYKGRHITKIVSIISMLSAAVLLVVAIISLYIVNHPTTKLVLVVTYTFLFAISVGLLTNARKAEVFSAAAAYAAVLVVFISGNLGQQTLQQP